MPVFLDMHPFLPCSSHRNIGSFITNGFKAQNISLDYEMEAEESALQLVLLLIFYIIYGSSG
jgi:hypothetical protein